MQRNAVKIRTMNPSQVEQNRSRLLRYLSDDARWGWHVVAVKLHQYLTGEDVVEKTAHEYLLNEYPDTYVPSRKVMSKEELRDSLCQLCQLTTHQAEWIHAKRRGSALEYADKIFKTYPVIDMTPQTLPQSLKPSISLPC
jgi:hypothetical protein